MASAFGHIVSALGIGSIFPKRIMKPKVFLIGAVSAALPDIDVLSNYFGILGLDILGHRGITHSLFFALLWSQILLVFFHRKSESKWFLTFYYFICTASHGIIDGLTNGGDGISYFAPFSSERLRLPYEIIEVSPLGIRNFFSGRGLEVLQSEFVWIAIPSLTLIMLSATKRKMK